MSTTHGEQNEGSPAQRIEQVRDLYLVAERLWAALPEQETCQCCGQRLPRKEGIREWFRAKEAAEEAAYMLVMDGIATAEQAARLVDVTASWIEGRMEARRKLDAITGSREASAAIRAQK